MGRQEKDENEERGNWDNKWEYLLSLAGYAIGLGNVWRFPYLCYRNGGGAFLIPYLMMLFVVGIPAFLLESSVGQFSSSGCLTLYKVCPIFKGIGYTSVMVSLIASTYYSVIVAYPLIYLYYSLTSSVPWASCDNEWNTPDCLAATSFTEDFHERSWNSTNAVSAADEFFHNYVLEISPGIEEPDGLVWPTVFATAFVWAVVFLCIFRGVKVVGKVVWLTTTFPYVMLLILFVRGVTLPGAWEGIKYYIYPDLSKLTHYNIWADAAVQIFFSLGPGFGSVITMSSFNRFRNDSQRDALFIPVLNCATSIFAGFVVFSVLGFLAHMTGKSVADVPSAGPALAFIAYPEALSLLPLSPLWSVLFFLMLFFLGIGSVFVQIEAMTESLMDEFPRRRNRKGALTFVACLVMFLLALFCCTRGGMYVTLILDTYSATVPIIFACLCEVIVFSYIYGSGRVARDVEMMTNKPLNYFWYIMWLVLTPFCLLLIFLEVVVVVRPPEYRDSVSPSWVQAAGWMSAIASISTIPAYALWYLASAEGSLAKRMASAFTASPAWGPALESHRRAWDEYAKTHPLRHPLLHPRLRRSLWAGGAPPPSSTGVYPPKDGGRSLEMGVPLTNGTEGH